MKSHPQQEVSLKKLCMLGAEQNKGMTSNQYKLITNRRNTDIVTDTIFRALQNAFPQLNAVILLLSLLQNSVELVVHAEAIWF